MSPLPLTGDAVRRNPCSETVSVHGKEVVLGGELRVQMFWAADVAKTGKVCF